MEPISEEEYGPAQKLIARHQQVSYPYRCYFGGAELQITDGVFCPTLTNVSDLLLRAIDFKTGERVLDVFSGCGAFGIISALRGSTAVTVDISSKAVECTRTNIRLNGVTGLVTARQGNLNHCVTNNEQFNLVMANPPLLPGKPKDTLSASIFDPGFQSTIDFIERLPSLLTHQGRCYVVVSDVMSRNGVSLDKLCERHGLASAIAREQDFGYELYTVYKITLPQWP